MKVLHIEAGKHLYGGAKQVAYIINELAKQDVENILVCTQGSEIAAQTLHNCQILPIKMGGEADVGSYFRLRNLVKELKPDLVHVHSRRGADIWGLLAAKACNTAVVCSRRVDNPEPVWLSKLKYHNYDKIIAISEGIRQVLLNQSVDSEQVVTVHSAVDTQVYQPRKDKAWFHQEFATSAEHLVIANFAQMIERKGQPLLIEAISQLVPNYPHLRVLLFGRGPKLDQYQQQVRDLDLEDYIQFPGFRTDVARILPNIDIVAHPAYAEGLGVALLQASACAVPIVAGAAGGIPEVVQDGINGLLFKPGELNQLTEHLERLIQSEDLRTQLSKSGRELMREKFSITAMANGNLAVYKSVLAKRHSR